MFLVTLSAPEAMGRLGQYQAIRNTMLKDPEKAQEMIDKFGDFKVPVFINGSIHDNEYPGVDAAMRLIETFAYSDDPEVMEILENVILLINVVRNPDGRVLGTRANAAGFDTNRDFITQSQPETRATVRVLSEWNPMVVLDLHGFVNPMLIEPCTPPHNPNYEYDLYIKWAFRQAEADELLAETPYDQYNELTIMDFPAAYVIPKDASLQQSPYEAARLVDFLLRNDVQVEQASRGFSVAGITYPKGTYVVSMTQPKRGLASTILWNGWDISEDPGLTMYGISGWSHPLLWGATVALMEEDQELSTNPINAADPLLGSVEGGKAGAYAYLPLNNAQKIAVEGDEGIRYFLDKAGFDYNRAYATASGQYNGVVTIDYKGGGPLTAYYPPLSHGFIYRPLWFTDWPAEENVAARYAAGDFFVSGYWPNWPTSGAAGQPVVVNGQHGAGEISLMGINPTFRAHPEQTFRLLANGIHNGLD